MRELKKIKTYFETHFASSFILLMGVAILCIMVLLQSYLKREYFDYLMEKSYDTEKAVMESMQKNVNYSIREMINDGSELAVNSQLYELILKADSSLEENREITKYILNLYTMLQKYDYLNGMAAVAVVGKNGLITHYDKYRGTKPSLWTGEYRLMLEDIVDSFWNQQKFPRYREFLEPGEYVTRPDIKVFHVAYPITGGEVSVWNADYTLVMSYTMDIFDEFLDTVEVPKIQYVQGYVADEDGKIIYHNDETYIGCSEDELLQMGTSVKIKENIGYFGWTLNVVLDETLMRQHVDQIYQNGLIFYIILLIGYIIIFAFLLFRLMHPVKLISDSIMDVESGNYHSQINIGGKHEIWQLAEEYNRMITAIESKNEEIRLQHEERLRSIEQQHQAEREALESQINAHFICNTLGCINYEAIEAGNYQIAVLIKKLSNILRYTFDQKCQEVYMYQEIAWVDQYLYLQKMRYETKFDYKIEFQENYNQWPCCKLMFQPFVENSILHGFEGRESGGIIRITGYAEGNRLKIVIRDNGCGINREKAEIINKILRNKENKNFENREKVGIGIMNVATRMRMYYGNDMDIFMETEVGVGTAFTFLIPIPQKKGEIL